MSAHPASAFRRELTATEMRALRLIRLGYVAVVWLEESYEKRGRKPWYSLTGGVRPTTLHELWLQGLIRRDPMTPTHKIEGSAGLQIARAKPTTEGMRVLRGLS